MRNLFLIAVLALASCLLPTDDPAGDEAGLLADPPATWGQVQDACVGYCLHVYGYHCAETLRWYWFGQCRDGCIRLADEAESTGCTTQAVGWMECEQTQQFVCWGAWPYQLTDYCHAEGDAYGACRSDS